MKVVFTLSGSCFYVDRGRWGVILGGRGVFWGVRGVFLGVQRPGFSYGD